MELRQLTTFITVAETLNFTRAAERLHLAQSSVSAQIRALEKELGVMLFDRIGKQVFLTEAGRKLFQYARKIESMTAEIRDEVAGQQTRGGRLTIRMPETLANHYMVEVITRFQRAHPRAELHFINCADRELSRELSSGRIDLALLMTDDISMKDVNIHHLKTEELVIAAAAGHPFSGSSLALQDLQGQLLLLPKTD